MKRGLLFILLVLTMTIHPVTAQDIPHDSHTTWDETVMFSHPGGFYQESFMLSLECTFPTHQIRYTLNGNTPDSTSALYTVPMMMDSAMFSKSNIYTIVDCIPSQYFLADDVERAIVIRAAVFNEEGERISEVATQTYLINALGCDTHGLPVLSLTADSLDLFDYETGIFVPGASYDSSDSTHTGNYYNKGREWERRINMEFYETSNDGINQQCGLRTHGGASRWFQQKGMKLYAREEYGKKRFKHAFFEDTPLDSFKHLNLKPFRCSNWLHTGGQDYLSNRIAHRLNMESSAVREVIVFLNGEYWGIYTLEETPDERYLEDHWEVDIDSCNIIKYWGVTEHGDGMDWWRLRNWMGEAILNHEDDFAYACNKVDVPCFIDYEIFEIFSSNCDWPVNNALCWQAAEGKHFRFIFYDGDGCFSKTDFDAWGNATDSILQHPTSAPHATLFFRCFMQNPDFRQAFAARYAELKDSYLSIDTMCYYWQCYYDLAEANINTMVNRFHFPMSYQRWKNDMMVCKDFLMQRDETFRAQMSEYFTLDETTYANEISCYPNPFTESLTLMISETTAGTIPIIIYDATGTICYSNDVVTDGTTRITIHPNLPAGLYLLQAGKTTKKIIKI